MKVLQFPSAYRAGERPYDIFKDRMTAITSIAGGIKDMISNKYINKQMAMIAENIQSEIDKQKVIDLTHLISGSPPDEIYPANLEDTIGQFIDKFTMGPMMRKETMTGGLPSVGGATPTPTTEAMIPKTDLYQLYNAIKEIPSGEVSWDNIYKKMTEKKPWFMGTTGPEQYVIDQMMGQAGDPRAKMTSDINLAKLYQETFHPEEIIKEPTEWDKKLDLFLQTNPSNEEVKKFVGGWVAPDKLSDFDKRFDVFMQTEPSVDEMKKFMGGYITPERPSDFDKKLDLFMQTDPSVDEVKKFVNAYIIPGGVAEGKVTTAEVNLVEKQFTGVRTNTQYEQALAKVRQVDPNVIVPSKPEMFRKNYDDAMAQIRMLINEAGEILKETSKSGYSYEMLYTQAYKDIEEAINEYRIATGETLTNPFVSLEDYHKTDVKPKEVFKPGTWGQQKSVFAGETLYKDGETKVINGKTYKYNAERGEWEELGAL